jgi:inosine-uridine nucleoside N-ribohydrolase
MLMMTMMLTMIAIVLGCRPYLAGAIGEVIVVGGCRHRRGTGPPYRPPSGTTWGENDDDDDDDDDDSA